MAKRKNGKLPELEKASLGERDPNHMDAVSKETSNEDGLEIRAENNAERTDNLNLRGRDNMTDHPDPNHEPAKTKATANVEGMETDATNIAKAKNKDGRTNPIDETKNTGPGPGNPEFRAGEVPKADKGQKTQETPKVVHETTTAGGGREQTNNVIADMNERRPLIKQAQRYGIYVDNNWSDDRIRAELQQALEGRADLQVKGVVPDSKMGSLDYDPATSRQKDPQG